MPSRLYQTRPPLCPVTALAFYPHGSQLLVLAGEGGWLAIYDAEHDIGATAGSTPALRPDRRCLGRIRIFAEQAMQGLRVDDSSGSGNVLVWGGQSLALVTPQHISCALSVAHSTAGIAVREVIAPDWIYDALLPRAGGCGALITAHNEAISFMISDAETAAEPSLTLAGASISPSRPMLYSAQLAWAGADAHSSTDSTRNRLLVAAGTVFGEIVVWMCQLAADEPSIKVLQVFTGHEGSIFDVVVSPPMHLGARKARLLASCSDDRTIRIWPLYLDAEPLDGETDAHALQAATNTARETGFQNTFEGLAHRSDDHAAADTAHRQVTRIKNTYLQINDPAPPSSPTSTPPIATVMAHASRIWHVRFGDVASGTAGQDQHDHIHIYSFGEDACAREWQLELDTAGQNLSAELIHLRTLSLHSGKNIWSATVFIGAKNTKALIATGGSDGKICLFLGQSCGQTLPEKLSEVVVTSAAPPNPHPLVVPQTTPVPLQEAEVDPSADNGDGTAAGKPKKKKKVAQKKFRDEIFNSYAFLSDDQLLSATSHGRLLLGQFQESTHGLSTSSSIKWTELPDIPETISQSLKDYNVVRSPRGGGGGGMATVPGVEGLAFLGTASGQLFLYSSASGQVHELATKLPGKVDEIFFLPHTKRRENEGALIPPLQLEIIATTLFRDEAALLDITIDIATGTLLSSRSDRTLKLPKKAPTSPTAMTITAASKCLDYIVLGSRNGQLCLYKPAVSGADGGVFELETQLQTRTKDAILSIVPLPSRASHPPLSCSSFVVTARDGTYRIYSIERTQSPAQITLQHETATPFGPIVRDAWFVDSETPGEPPELVICGFRSTNFVVWNETRQQELATVDCGGTHRTHTYLHYGASGKENKENNANKIRFAFTRNSELHLFAQNACATSPLKRGGHGREIRAVSASASGRYVATGGEDTVVRIWSSGTGQADAAGERRCLSVLKLHNTGLHNLTWLGDGCLISAAGSEELFIWRMTTIGDSAYDGLAVLCESSYPDSTSDKVLRIIGLDASLDESADKSHGGESMFISVGISNSVIKTYRYTAPTECGGSGLWTLAAQGHYTGACPTQVRHLKMGLASELVVLAAFADGHLTVWRAAAQGGDYTLACATKAHQNAVKGFDLLARSPSSPSLPLVILTGGDDNGLAVTTLHWEDGDDKKYSFGKTFRVANAHAASVNGAKILNASQNCTIDGLDYTGFTAVTCSNDQRVKGWRILMAHDSSAARPVRIQLLNNAYSAIADPGDVERVAGQDGSCGAIVVGMGMETWSLE